MGQITSNIGLITGINITDTVDKLIAFEARPRDLVAARNKDDQNEQVAVKDLAARLLSLEFSAKKLSDATLFNKTAASSSNTAALSVTVTGSPALGEYQYTPLQAAQAEQVIASGYSDGNALVGAGQLSFRFGGFLDSSASLDDINGGNGFERGLIRITDRAGHAADIDLRFARTVDDVLAAINKNSTISVHAEVQGDHIRLTDTTGQSSSSLKVQEVNQGTTAASLGLADVNVAASSADGKDVVQLYAGLSLDKLNGGAGVRFDEAKPDLQFHFRDNSSPLSIDFNVPPATGETAQKQRTLGDVLARINAADPTRLKAAIGPDGDRIVLTDLTTDAGGSFTVENLNDSHAAGDLGLIGDLPPNPGGDGSTIAGRRLSAGLRNSLLSELNGGAGLGKLGLLSLTDRTGAQATVDLSAAETTDDVIDAINASGLQIKARVNDARNGIQVDDVSGATTSNLIVANGDATTDTAAKLNLAIDQASNSVNGGNLKLRIVSSNTTLASLNGGAGVTQGTFTVFDTTGHGSTLKIDDTHKTIGDVIQAINGLNLKIRAEINETGDGIALVDTGHGSGKIRVVDGTKSTAAGLHLNGESTVVDVFGVQTAVLDGSTAFTLKIEATDKASDVIAKFNALKSGVTASSVNDGSSNKPFRLVFSGQRSGAAAEFAFDTSAASFDVSETIKAQDARLLSGSSVGFGKGIIASSATGTFTDVLPGATLKVNAASDAPVTVSVTTVDTNLVGTVQAIVDTYNSLQDKLADYTKYDTATGARGILQADTGVQRIQSELSTLFSRRLAGAGSIHSLGEVGIALDPNGKLTFDATAFRDKFASDPTAVSDFFTTKDRGFVDKLKAVLEQSAGETSLLANRNLALERRIALNQERINFYTAKLDRSRQRWLLKFNNLELAIGKIKNNLSALDQIQFIKPPTS